MCADEFSPSEQIGSDGIHKSMALAPYSGLIAVSGAPGRSHSMDSRRRLPRRRGQPPWAASARGLKPRGNGTPAEVMRSITTAPREYPPSTILVLGQFAAMYWT